MLMKSKVYSHGLMRSPWFNSLTCLRAAIRVLFYYHFFQLLGVGRSVLLLHNTHFTLAVGCCKPSLFPASTRLLVVYLSGLISTECKSKVYTLILGTCSEKCSRLLMTWWFEQRHLCPQYPFLHFAQLFLT